MPTHIIYMDAIEGGRVEERLREEGAMVKAGEVILRLSNPLLNIGIMPERSRSGLSGKRTAQHPHQHGAGTVATEAGTHRRKEGTDIQTAPLRAIRTPHQGATDCAKRRFGKPKRSMKPPASNWR